MYKNQTQILKEKKIGENFCLIGKLINHNKGENFDNIDLLLPANFSVNIKLEVPWNSKYLNKEKIYVVQVVLTEKKTKNILLCQNIKLIEKVANLEDIYKYYQCFFSCAPISFQIIDDLIQSFLAQIKNKIIYQITSNLYLRYQYSFLISPAAFKMHHDYYGGLGYHVSNMLKISVNFLTTYPYLNKDLLYAGIILHDMSKIEEFNFEEKNYTQKGILLGHLVLGANQIHQEALSLGYQDTEEVLLLKHLIISHHGLLEYGSAKKPQIGEALILWYLDDIDAKLTALGDKLLQTSKGNFTIPLNALEKRCFYKPNLSKKDE
ncbi:HD domain-containing protein [Candidatus Phytoplasma phoenicium]|uniref:Cmp binding factor 1 n=1 Tax=Candidatus Phytoplasma phoenicium TaxID=198422 RepID=A0A0L0MIT3_9MOLU|nr:HD domain-containing protein [Candidatus Phytoplasma phoenicium]KND62562.1 Cmp binding factor 1 [Candidatus Phytoplasma phoenicium]